MSETIYKLTVSDWLSTISLVVSGLAFCWTIFWSFLTRDRSILSFIIIPTQTLGMLNKQHAVVKVNIDIQIYNSGSKAEQLLGFRIKNENNKWEHLNNFNPTIILNPPSNCECQVLEMSVIGYRIKGLRFENALGENWRLNWKQIRQINWNLEKVGMGIKIEKAS